MPFDDLRKINGELTLTLPIGGKKYVIPECTAETFKLLQDMQQNAEEGVEDPNLGMSTTELYRLCLGDKVYGQLLKAVKGSELRVAGMTAYFWQMGAEEVAEQIWQSGGKALAAPAPNRADRRRTATRTRTGAASTTRSRASRSGTSSRKKSSSSARG